MATIRNRPETIDLREDPRASERHTEPHVAETSTAQHAQHREEAPTATPGRRFDTLRFLVAGALLSVLAMFAAANDQTVEIDLVVASEAVPLAGPLAGAMFGGAVLAFLLRRG